MKPSFQVPVLLSLVLAISSSLLLPGCSLVVGDFSIEQVNEPSQGDAPNEDSSDGGTSPNDWFELDGVISLEIVDREQGNDTQDPCLKQNCGDPDNCCPIGCTLYKDGDCPICFDGDAHCGKDCNPPDADCPNLDDANSSIHYRSITNAPTNDDTDYNVHYSVDGSEHFLDFISQGPASIEMGDKVEILKIPDLLGTAYVMKKVNSERIVLQDLDSDSLIEGDYEVKVQRAYSGINSWAAAVAIGGRGGDLVGEKRREIGICYLDDPASYVENVMIGENSGNNYRADSNYYMVLTVAKKHRHQGNEGVPGVKLEPPAGNDGIKVYTDYTRVDGFEIAKFGGCNCVAGASATCAANVLFQNLLVHDFQDPNYSVVGIRAGLEGNSCSNGFTSNVSLTVRNSICYDGIMGIMAKDLAAIEVQNCTIVDMLQYGMYDLHLDSNRGTITSINTISTCNADGTTICIDFGVDNFAQHSNLICGDASCEEVVSSFAYSDPGKLFFNLSPDAIDLHLKSEGENAAIDTGTALESPTKNNDIDGQLRPIGSDWDIGADEYYSGK